MFTSVPRVLGLNLGAVLASVRPPDIVVVFQFKECGDVQLRNNDLFGHFGLTAKLSKVKDDVT